MVPFSFAGHELLALPQGALFWPARRALLVADLHFEKASWFAARRADAAALRFDRDAGRLTALVEAIGAGGDLVPRRQLPRCRGVRAAAGRGAATCCAR